MSNEDLSGVIDRLRGLSPKEFHTLVDEEIRGRTLPEEAQALRTDPMLCEFWYQTLVRMKKSVEGTLAAKGEDAKAARLQNEQQMAVARQQLADADDDLDAAVKANHEIARLNAARRLMEIEAAKWRAGAIRFKVGVEERLADVRFTRFTLTPKVLESAAMLERDMLGAAYRTLVEAVQQHREAIQQDDDSEATAEDQALWELVN